MTGRRIVIFGWASSPHIKRWASGLVARGSEVLLVSLGNEALPDVSTITFPYRGKRGYLRYAARAAAAARKFNPDIIHVHYATGFGIWGVRTNFHPTVVSVWGTDVMEFPSTWLKKALTRLILRRADHVTATSCALREAAIKLVPGVADKTTVVPFGVDVPSEVSPMPPPPVRLAYIKLHHPRYAPDVLIRALIQIRRVIPDVSLTMMGDGSMTPRLKAMVRDLGLNDCVAFPGMVPLEQMYEVLRAHHIMVMPSLREGFGVAVLDAAAAARPTVASNVGGVPEVVKDGVTGVLVPPGDADRLAEAVIGLARDTDRRTRMGLEAYRFVKEKYSWQESLDRMTALYERLIHEAKITVN